MEAWLAESTTFVSHSVLIHIDHTFVNVPFTPIDMNEVTLKSALATHSTYNLQRIGTILDMPQRVQVFQSRYAVRI